jgi:hypothetical protein
MSKEVKPAPKQPHKALRVPNQQVQSNEIRAPRKISPFQCFCGHEKVANLAAKLEVLISTIDDIT